MPKKVKIDGMEEALAKLPEEDREATRKEIEEMFADFDPKNPPGRRVIPLTGDEVTCPECGSVLRLEGSHTTILPDGMPRAGTPIEFVHCAVCDQPFERAPRLIGAPQLSRRPLSLARRERA
jgi:hypothetical protein